MKRLVLAAPFLATMTCLAGEIETVDSSPFAEGGDYIRKIQIDEHNWSYVHVFTNASSVQTFKNTADWSLKVRYLVVGGGGAGGNGEANYGGGGGGGGGVAERENAFLAAGASWSVRVGRGAVEQSTQAGGSSISNGVNEICAVPGGGSGGHAGADEASYVPPIDGAAGGGAARLSLAKSKVAKGMFPSFVLKMVPPTDGYSGGKSCAFAGGGGGGAGEAGEDGVSDNGYYAGKGGEGLLSDITGEDFVYGSGGGGGSVNGTSNMGPGASGGTNAGNGGGQISGTTTTEAPTKPVANSGAGGGGGCGNKGKPYTVGSLGADGIVVIRYDYNDYYPCVGGDWVKVIPKSETKTTFIHVFTNAQVAASFFNRSGKDLKIRYLVVGGGGAGGSGSANYPGGGGGGGGVAEVNRVVLATGTEWTVRVGAGSTEELTQAGGSSISNGVNEVCAVPGGGSGGRRESDGSYSAAREGAAGGGGATNRDPSTGVDQNNPGAGGLFASYVIGMTPPLSKYSGGESWSYFAGGGGGAGEAGSSPNKLK